MSKTARQQARILVIDDDQDIWKAYRLVLTTDELSSDSSSARIGRLLNDGQDQGDDPGFALSFASQGQDGYQMVAEGKEGEPFAMAFIDIRMPPGWDGMETAVKIRQLDPEIELVVVTAYSDRSMEEIVRAVGASDKLLFLRKPFDPDELKQIARCLTSKWRLSREEKEQRKARHHLVEQLQQAQKMESIGTLAGGIAHDFNNILSAIMGYADLALMRSQGNNELQDDLYQLRKAADRAADLVRQILTFSRRQKKEPHPLQISLVIKEALKLLRASIPSTIEIRQEVESQALVLADPTQVHQLIMNLCTNAYQSMLKSGVMGVTLTELTIDQGGAAITNGCELPPGRYVRLAISDTGYGMDQETMSKIFEPYFTTKEQGKGTGLGLAVVHGIVEGHHGRITVASEPGRGTTFTVFLPVADTEVLPEPKAVPTLRSGAGERIMVVDDEGALCDLARQFLTKAGYRVDIFANAIEAWQALSRTPKAWDLLVTDQTMPGMTGEQLASKLGAIRPEMPMILCSGFNVPAHGAQAKKMGVSACLQKPIDRETLLSSVAKVLATRTE